MIIETIHIMLRYDCYGGNGTPANANPCFQNIVDKFPVDSKAFLRLAILVLFQTGGRSSPIGHDSSSSKEKIYFCIQFGLVFNLRLQ